MDRIGLTWPNALPLTVYAQILQSARPEEECCVPMATMDCETDRIFSGIRPRPGAIFILRRKWWESKMSRKGQTRGRLEDGVQGGWNMSSSTHPAVRSVVGDPQNRKVLVDYMSRRKSADPATATGDDGYQSDTVLISAGLKRHEIFLVDSEYDASIPPAKRQPLPSICLMHYVQDDVNPDPRVMLPHAPIMIVHHDIARDAPRLMPPGEAGLVCTGGRASAAVTDLVADSRSKDPAVEVPTPFKPFHLGSDQPFVGQEPRQPHYSPAARPSDPPNLIARGYRVQINRPPEAEIDGARQLAPTAGPPHHDSLPPPQPSPRNGPHLAEAIPYKPTSYFRATLAQPHVRVQQVPVLSGFCAPPQYSADPPNTQLSNLNASTGTPPAAHQVSAPISRPCGKSAFPPMRAAPEWTLPVSKRQRNALSSGPTLDLLHTSASDLAAIHRRLTFEQTIALTTSTGSVISEGQIDQAIMQVLGESTDSTSSRAERGLRYADALQADLLNSEDLLNSFVDACVGPNQPVHNLF
jgi:hypothetical protein